MKFRSALALLFGLLILSELARAEDVYLVAVTVTHTNRPQNYSMGLLRAALEASKPQYGPYRLQSSPLAMQHKRIMREIAAGDIANITAQVTNQEWEQSLIPIRIPIDKGLASFRISLIDERRQGEFARVTSLEQLRKFTVGVGDQWTLRDVYAQNGLPLVAGTNYDGLFGMLMEGRFDYMPRSIEEALQEQPEQAQHFPHLAIEQSFMLYVPAPRYFFVSPHAPRLAKRLQDGLEKMIASGEFDRYFIKYYGPMIARARLCTRTLLKVKSDGLSKETPLKNARLWFDPFDAAGRKLACKSTQPQKSAKPLVPQ